MKYFQGKILPLNVFRNPFMIDKLLYFLKYMEKQNFQTIRKNKMLEGMKNI